MTVMTSRQRAADRVIHGAFAVLFVLVLYPFFTDYTKQVLSVGIWALTTEFSGQYGPMFAGYVFGSLPLILVFMFGSKYYVEGLLSGALKF